jgi:hypothetical protein
VEDPNFDFDSFLAEPRNAIVATNGTTAPVLRTLSFQWEEGAFWIITGPWAKIIEHVEKDPNMSLLVDCTDYEAGRLLQVVARGTAEIVPYEIDRAYRSMARYRGPDVSTWSTSPVNYPSLLEEPLPPGLKFIKLKPKVLKGYNYSYSRSPYGMKSA